MRRDHGGAAHYLGMAHEHNILYVPHGCPTAVGLAADLHLTAAVPVCATSQHLTPSLYLALAGDDAVPAGTLKAIRLCRDCAGLGI